MSGQMDTPHTGTPGTDATREGMATSARRTRSSVPSLPGINGGSTVAPAVPEPDVLAGLPLFRGLTTEQLSKLSALLRCKRSPTGTEIITANQPGKIAYIILEGSVKVHAGQLDDSDVILAILGAGEVVGEMSLADSLGRSASVTTLEPSALLLIERASFWASLKEMPRITYNLINILSRRLRLANVHAQSLSSLDVYGRVAGQLLAFAREYGEAAPNGDVLIPLRLTQSDLAGMVGASRVRVNQALSFYKRRNYLSINQDRHIVVHDMAALSRRCS
jgi:CRP/FNR family transcriptional regulator, cyclic AMP receptor protein